MNVLQNTVCTIIALATVCFIVWWSFWAAPATGIGGATPPFHDHRNGSTDASSSSKGTPLDLSSVQSSETVSSNTTTAKTTKNVQSNSGETSKATKRANKKQSSPSNDPRKTDREVDLISIQEKLMGVLNNG